MTEDGIGKVTAALASMFQGPDFEDVICHGPMLPRHILLETSNLHSFPGIAYLDAE